MTFRMCADGIWREFNDVDEAVDFVMGNCLVCRKKCQGMFCRSCYEQSTPEQRRAVIAKHRGRVLGTEKE